MKHSPSFAPTFAGIVPPVSEIEPSVAPFVAVKLPPHVLVRLGVAAMKRLAGSVSENAACVDAKLASLNSLILTLSVSNKLALVGEGGDPVSKLARINAEAGSAAPKSAATHKGAILLGNFATPSKRDFAILAK